MSAADRLELVEIGARVRDTVTGREGAVLWLSTPGATVPSVLVRWDDGDRSAYGADEVGGRLVRWDPR